MTLTPLVSSHRLMILGDHSRSPKRLLPSLKILTNNGDSSSLALLKRGYIGVFYHMSEKHLYRYVNYIFFLSQHFTSWHDGFYKHDCK